MTDITNFDIGQGETFKILAHIYTETTGSVPLNIASCSFSGQIRENYTTDELAAQFTIVKLEPHSSGSIFVYLYPETTSQLSQRSYVYDIVMTNEAKSPPTVRRLLEGSFRVRPAVTR